MTTTAAVEVEAPATDAKRRRSLREVLRDRRDRRRAAWRLFKKRWPQIRHEVLPWVRRFVMNIVIAGWVFAAVETYLAAEGEGMTFWEGFFNGPWWGIVTGTTTGYGDLYPNSIPGKWLAVYLMLSSIGLQTITIIKGTEVMVKNPHLYSHAEQEREEAKSDLSLAINMRMAEFPGVPFDPKSLPEYTRLEKALLAVETEERADA